MLSTCRRSALQPDALFHQARDPDQSGVCLDSLRSYPRNPHLGRLPRHQAIAQVYGGRVVRASEQMHGKTSPFCTRAKAARGFPPLTATCHHSLIAERETLLDCLEVTAWLEDGTIGPRHRDHLPARGAVPPGKCVDRRRPSTVGQFSDRAQQERRYFPPVDFLHVRAALRCDRCCRFGTCAAGTGPSWW